MSERTALLIDLKLKEKKDYDIRYQNLITFAKRKYLGAKIRNLHLWLNQCISMNTRVLFFLFFSSEEESNMFQRKREVKNDNLENAFCH
jgi:hypothetical protein